MGALGTVGVAFFVIELLTRIFIYAAIFALLQVTPDRSGGAVVMWLRETPFALAAVALVDNLLLYYFYVCRRSFIALFYSALAGLPLIALLLWLVWVWLMKA